jgi:xylulokinase
LWEAALGPAIAAALDEAGTRPSAVRGLAICGQLDGCLPVDDRGRPLGPCLIWMDRRAEAEMAGIPGDLVRRRTGIQTDPGHMAAKIRWLAGREPAAAGPARYHQPVSYMVERLTGAAVVDPALASTTMLCALGERRWDAALLDLFAIEAATLPRIADAWSAAGVVHADGAALSGLAAGTPVAVGTGDDFSTALGAGIVAPGPVSVGIGTGEVVGAVHPEPLIDADGLVETHAYPAGGYFIENPGWLGGGSVAWLVSVLGLDGPGEVDALAAEAPPGADGVLFLPALNGAMTPRWRPAARGCFYGLASAHGRVHLARAVLEGCAFAMRDVVLRLDRMGVATDPVMLLGGGARSEVWRQIRADAIGRPVMTPRHVDTSPLGAAMLAGVASGIFAGPAEAASLLGSGGEWCRPDPRARAAYEDSYAAYRRLFDTLEPMFA